MSDLTVNGVTAWDTSNLDADDDIGFCITNTKDDGGPTINIYVKDGAPIGLIVYDYPDGMNGRILSRWGMVPAHLVESM